MRELMRRNELSDLFENFWRITPQSFLSGNGSMTVDEGTLALDVSETEDAVVVRGSLPGFEKKDVDIEVHDNVLSIKATHTEEHEEHGERFYRRERQVGSLSRRVALPSHVEGDKARASLRNGVLEVKIPKSPEASPRKLQIQD